MKRENKPVAFLAGMVFFSEGLMVVIGASPVITPVCNDIFSL